MEDMGTFVWFGSSNGNTGLSLFTKEECDEKRFYVTNLASYLDRVYQHHKHSFADKSIASMYLPDVGPNSI